MRCFFEYVREQRLPSDLLGIFDAAGVKFYEGALSPSYPDAALIN